MLLEDYFSVSIRPTTGIKPLYPTIATVTMNLIVTVAIVGSVSKSVSGRNSKKGPAKILTGPNKFVILGDKT